MSALTRSFGEGRLVGLPRGHARQRTWTTFIVGITGDGYVPVVEQYLASTGRSIVALPFVAVDVTPPHRLEQMRAGVAKGLLEEFGYAAGELVPMEPGPGNGDQDSTFLLAPLLEAGDWRARGGFVPGVYEVALRAVPEWLRQRRLAGATETPALRQGLLLAQEFFPRWAQSRLSEALQELRARPAISST